MLTKLRLVSMTIFLTHSECYKSLEIIFLIFLQLMDTEDHTKVMNNKIVGKGRTQDRFNQLQCFSQEEKKRLAERTDCANSLVLLSLTEFSL